MTSRFKLVLLGVAICLIVSGPAAATATAAVTATASSQYSTTYTPAKAIDGSTTTWWAACQRTVFPCTDSLPWLRINYGLAKSINHVAVNWENAYAPQYVIETSTDGTNFVVRQTETATSAGVKHSYFPTVSAQYLRIRALQSNPTYSRIAIREVVADTGNRAPSAPVLSVANEGNGQVTVSWTASTDPDGNLRHYQPYKDGVYVTSLPTTQFSYTYTGLTNGVTYRFRVQAIDTANVYTRSNDVLAVPNSDVQITTNRGASSGQSRWKQGYTVVHREFSHPYSDAGGTNEGPDTLAGTAQYNARQLEKQALTRHNVHIMAWGRGNPWPTPASPPDPNAPYGTGSWGGCCGLDQEIKRASDAGMEPMITLAMAPGWMMGHRTAGNGCTQPIADWGSNFYSARVTTDNMPKWKQLVSAIVKRYAVAPYNVRTFQVWNELKGFYNADTNNYDTGLFAGTPAKCDQGYTHFYNETRAAVLAAAASVGVSGMRTGGPYIVQEKWNTANAGGYPVNDGNGSSNNTLSGAKSYGYVDRRGLDAVKTWLAGKTGAEFIDLRFGNGARDVGVLGLDWDSLNFERDLAQWVRGLPEATYPGATTLPFFNAEHYTHQSTDVGPAKAAAFSAESYRIGIQNGYEAMLRWGSKGLDGVDLWTSSNQLLVAGTGLEGNSFAVEKLFKDEFPVGTVLYTATSSDPSKLTALSNATDTVLINKTSGALDVDVNGTLVTLPAYGVQRVAA